MSLSLELGGLVIDKDAEAQLMQAASLNGAEGYRMFLEVCNDEVSKVVVGQTLSSSAKATGLGSGVAKLHAQVRQDFRQSDMRKLGATLVNQCFHPYLKVNGYPGRIRGIIWGGKDEEQVQALSESMKNFSDAGLRPDEVGIETISERTGISFERAPEPKPDSDSPFGGGNGNGKGQPEAPAKAAKPPASKDDHDRLKSDHRKLRSDHDKLSKQVKNLKVHAAEGAAYLTGPEHNLQPLASQQPPLPALKV
jgi:hypothetical protein